MNRPSIDDLRRAIRELLAEELDPGSESREDLELIVEQAERCRKIVSGLLNFARRNRVTLREEDLGELVSSSLKSLALPATLQVVQRMEGDEQRRDAPCRREPLGPGSAGRGAVAL